MDEQHRVVTSLPLDEMVVDGRPWHRASTVDRASVRSHLQADSPRIVVAVVSEPLRSYSGRSAFEVWKQEVEPRLAESDAFHLEDFPDERAYVATLWTDDEGLPLALFEQHH